jgi:hypothetical protein
VPLRYEPKDLEAITAQLHEENPRAIIIVGSSLLDYALEELIKSRLREPTSQEEASLLFSDTGIINSFYRKILLAYFMKLIGPTAMRDFDLIRKIRNEVAHNMNPVSFDNPTIASRCRELTFAKQSIPGNQTSADLRGKFILSVYSYVGFLMLRAADQVTEVQQALQHVSKYLDC